ncbi:hypothetical protein B0T19DRAFT_451865 [Cercophora scortea]|uniref:Actin-like ATPase domain-containing protein n=1 Tax=Cercophora scortea TaxID=314031 RepID=A0AAE0I251_9PEZI|nr:hypothetical protein B0T19DRAFT_451865 [Cercophora scortea]
MAGLWGQDILDSTPIEYILTVPAVWSDKAKADTLACASGAGFRPIETIRLINEPEAAAVWTFNQLPHTAVKAGDVFITVDAGGGTVDLTTFQILSMSPVLRVSELTEGGGGLCGSVYLNKRFEDLVERKIGKQLGILSEKEYGVVMQEFQSLFNDDIKPDFGVADEPTKTYFIPLPPSVPDDASAGIENGQFAVTAAEMDGVFSGVVQNIIGLITDQVEKVEEKAGCPEVSAILLVGGFGGSAYLRKAIEKHFDGSAMPKTGATQPAHARPAVTRGAMLRGLQGDIVTSRVIRAAYGVVMYTEWDPAVHESDTHRKTAEGLKFWSELKEAWCCDSVMSWYVQKGEEFTKEKVVTASFFRRFVDLTNLVFETKMIIWSGNGRAPYFKDDDCKAIAILRADFSKIPKHEIEVITTPTGRHYRVEYQIEMRFETRITFRLIYKGKVLSDDLAVDYGT